MDNLSTPTWIFMERKEYRAMDIAGDIICFVLESSPTLANFAYIKDMPESTFTSTFDESVTYLKILKFDVDYFVLILFHKSIAIFSISQNLNSKFQIKERFFSQLNIEDERNAIINMDRARLYLAVGDGKILKFCNINISDFNLVSIGSHSCFIKDILFHPSSQECLISMFEDFTCKIWSLKDVKLLHTINYSKITAISVHPLDLLYIFGTKDGQICSVQLECPHKSFQLFQLPKNEVSGFSFNTSKTNNSNKPMAHRSQWSKCGPLMPSISAEANCEVLALTSLMIKFDCSSHTTRLLIISVSGTYIVDLISHQIEAFWKWSDMHLLNWNYVVNAGVTNSDNAVNFWVQGTTGEIVFFTLPYGNLIQNHADSICDKSSSNLSFIARDILFSDSVLQKSLKRPSISKVSNQRCNKPQKFPPRKSNKVIDKPITFGHTIKSSGYAKQEPVRQMFQPLIPVRPIKQKNNFEKGNLNKLTKLTKIYPESDSAPSTLLFCEKVDSIPSPIYHLSYSPNGERLASALGNGACFCLRTNLQKKMLSTAHTLCGHKAQILCTSWSSDSRLLLTSSADRTVRLWNMGDLNQVGNISQPKSGPKTQLIIDSINDGSTNDFGEKILNRKNFRSQNESFPDSIPMAYFHYMDSFIYIICRNIIRFYAYQLSDGCNVLEKGHANNFYKLAGQFNIHSCNQLTAVASVNIFYSYLVVCAGSDRRLSVLDLNHGKVIQETVAAHSRCITGISLNQGSLYFSFNDSAKSLPPSTNFSVGYSTFATVAPKDCVRIWDLREPNRPVIQLLRPQPENLAASGASRDPLIPPVNAAFSPCGKFLVVGGTTETNQNLPVIYDIRRASTQPLTILDYLPTGPGRTNEPTSVVAWHPSRPEISSGSYSGQISVFGIENTKTF